MRLLAAALVALTLVGAGCGSNGSGTSEGGSSKIPNDLTVKSSAFADGARIPQRYSCEGAGVSPPLEWHKVPDGTAELAIVIDDPDAPSGVFYHWVVTGIAPGRNHLEEGELPKEAVVATASSGKAAYIGMCPPSGDKPHHYRFKVYALTRSLHLDAGLPAKDAVTRVEGAAVGRGTLTALYSR
ncbi:MAG TPA: YbhB/YbcL family Raf kinase inhibitor-like protein [Acidimicrobiales bacterium]|nr:YbhB/YbcL family Raf kinase inhibitor-like protein [Acidimicrobiales bacterium]